MNSKIHLLTVFAIALVVGCSSGTKESGDFSTTRRVKIDSLDPIISVVEDTLRTPFSMDTFADNRLAVLDVDRKDVQIYDYEGNLIKIFGRKGKGPGEFVHPTSIFARDTSLIVMDVSLMRYSQFTLKGELLGINRIQKKSTFYGHMMVGEPTEYFTVANGYKGHLIGHRFTDRDTVQFFGDAFVDDPPPVSAANIKKGYEGEGVPDPLKNEVRMSYRDGSLYVFALGLSRLQKYVDEDLKWDKKLSLPVNKKIYENFEENMSTRGLHFLYYIEDIYATDENVYLLWDRTKNQAHQVVKVSSSGKLKTVYELPMTVDQQRFYASVIAVDEKLDKLFIGSRRMNEVYTADLP